MLPLILVTSLALVALAFWLVARHLVAGFVAKETGPARDRDGDSLRS